MTDKQLISGYPSIDKPWRKYYSEEQLNISVPEMTLTEYIYKKNKDRLHLPALRYFGRTVTYRELFEKIEWTGKFFQEHGVRENDYVTLAMPLIPEVIYMIYGLDSIGAAANLVDPRVPSERMRYYINLAQSKIAVVVSPYIAMMRDAASNSTVEKIFSVSPVMSLNEADKKRIVRDNYSKRERKSLLYTSVKNKANNLAFNIKYARKCHVLEYASIFRSSDSGLKKACYEKNRVAIVEYSSGTTGTPKGLELTARGMNATAEQISMINQTTPGDSILSIMPPFISYGAVTGIHMSLASGMEMILIPRFSVDHFAEYIKESKPNNIICVPSMFDHVIKSDLLEKEDLSYIKRVIFGGDRTTPDFEIEVNEWLHKHKSTNSLIKGGGMAEFSSCCFETPFDDTKKPGIYGIPLPLVDAKIMRDDHIECKYNEIGEIYISSPQQMRGYVNNPKETDAFFFTDENGITWGRTGDLGFVDQDGCFTLTSRKKQMIIRPDGHNVFPGEIENVIKSSGYVKECVVIGVKDEKSVIGEYPVAFIELKEKYLPASDKMILKIKEHVKKYIPLRDRPDENAYFSGKMIYSSEGKLDRNAMLIKLRQEMQSSVL